MRRQTPSSLRWIVGAAALLPVALAQQDSSSGPSPNTTIIAVCVVAGVVGILFVGGALVVCIRKRRARTPSRKSKTNPYGQMESPRLEAQLDSVPRGRADGQQPSTMYNDLNRAISDIFGSADDPAMAQPQHATRSEGNIDLNPPRRQHVQGSPSQSTFGRGRSHDPGSQAPEVDLSEPTAAYIAVGPTTNNKKNSGIYHYQRRQHSDEVCTLSKPMTRKSVSDEPFPRPMVVASPSYPPPRPMYNLSNPAPVTPTPVFARPASPPTSSSEESSQIMTPPSGKGRRKMPPVYAAPYGADFGSYDGHQAWSSDHTDMADYTSPAQSPVAAMFPKKMSVVEPAPIPPVSEPIIYDKDYAQLEKTRIAPAGSPLAAQTTAKEGAKAGVKFGQQQSSPAKGVKFTTSVPYEKARNQKKSDREAFQAAMRREGKRSAKQAVERFY